MLFSVIVQAQSRLRCGSDVSHDPPADGVALANYVAPTRTSRLRRELPRTSRLEPLLQRRRASPRRWVGQGERFQRRQAGKCIASVDAAHVRGRSQRGAERRALGPAEQLATQVIVQLHAGDAGRLAMRHSRDRRSNRRGDAAGGATGAAGQGVGRRAHAAAFVGTSMLTAASIGGDQHVIVLAQHRVHRVGLGAHAVPALEALGRLLDQHAQSVDGLVGTGGARP